MRNTAPNPTQIFLPLLSLTLFHIWYFPHLIPLSLFQSLNSKNKIIQIDIKRNIKTEVKFNQWESKKYTSEYHTLCYKKNALLYVYIFVCIYLLLIIYANPWIPMLTRWWEEVFLLIRTQPQCLIRYKRFGISPGPYM